MNFKIRHETLYRYSAPVSQSVNQLCLTPRTFGQQLCVSSELDITPKPDRMTSSEDCFGNTINYFNLDQRHTICSIVVNSIVQTTSETVTLPDSPLLAAMPSLMPQQIHSDTMMAHDCLLTSPLVPLSTVADDLVDRLNERTHTVLSFAEALMNLIYTEFTYDPSFSTVQTPMSEVLKARKGVCQDFAHLAIAVLRRAGIPARYISGYLETLPPPGEVKLQGADASHAWYSVFVPDVGWFDFDPTNNKRPDERYITTAWGRDYSDIAPIRGVVYGGGTHKLSVAVDVETFEPELISA